MNKILIADDDKEIRTLLKLLLGSANYDVTEAVNGDEALALLRAEHGEISLVLLDVTIPGRDGFEIGAEIRKFSNVPILYLTARGQEYDKIRGFAAGGDDYMIKPFASSELLARVGAILRRYLQYGAGTDPKNTPGEAQNIFSAGELCVDANA